MNRRNLLKHLGIISSFPLFVFSLNFGKDIRRSIYELRRYQLPSKNHQLRFDKYIGRVFIPALNRLGIQTVGAFSPLHFYDSYASLFMLIPYNTIEEAFTINEKLFNDKDFLENSDEFINTSYDNPVYSSYKNTIMLAFEKFPSIRLHEICLNKKRRYFNLRTYLSHSVKACKKKIEMFNTGGEIEIFQEVGYKLIFFGESIFGENMPNLSYMHVWEDLKTYQELGDKFWFHPKWVELSNKPEYKNITSDYFSILLKPKKYSQI